MKELLISLLILSTFSSCTILEQKEFVLRQDICNECLEDVEKQLSTLEGIYVLEVNKEQISFRYDKEKINLKAIESSLQGRNMLFSSDSLQAPAVCCLQPDTAGVSN